MKKIIFALLIAVCSLRAQEVEVYFNQLAEDYFLLGMRQYTQKDFKPALQSFRYSIQSYPMNHRITASTIMAAKTLYAMKQYREASALCDSFLLQFPSSEYVEDARFTKGMCLYNLGMYAQSIGEMLEVANIASQRKNKEHSLKMIEHISVEFLQESELDSIAAVVNDSSLITLLRVILAERLFSAGKYDAANNVLDSICIVSDDIAIQQRVQGLHARIERGNIVKVCALLPLLKKSTVETRDKKIAREVLEGIQLAVAEYEELVVPGQVAVELKVFDSERNPAVIDSIVSSLKPDSTIAAIIGPIFSNETIAAARAAQRDSIPLISPTATEDSIAIIGDYIFQTNSTSGMRGKLLAQYAVRVLRAKKAAILASDAAFSKVQADSFSVEMKRLGGEVIIDRRYKRGATDLREHCKAIRTAAASLAPEYHVIFTGKINAAEATSTLLAFGFRTSTIDSLLSRADTVNMSAYVGEKAQELVDSLKLPYKKNLPYVDSLQYPVSAIEVLFSPISTSQQIGVITSQIAYYNIKATILGTSEWHNSQELDMNRRYADGVIFGSDHWIEQNEHTKRISNLYAQRFSKQISDNVLFGYDVMSLLIKLFNEGSLTRQQVAAALSRVVNYPGVRNSITITSGRVNGDISILTYKDGVIKKLQTYTYQP